MKESELYIPVKNIFEPFGYEVYSEVEGKWFSKRADVIVTKDDKLLAIEMKTSLSFQLIDQARFWMRFADFVYVAVPKSKSKRSETAMECLSALGIGLIEIDMVQYQKELNRNRDEILHYNKYATISLQPRQNEVAKRDRQQFNNLTEEHKTWAIGGSKSGTSKYVTSYSLLMNDVYSYLREQLHNTDTDGWVTVKDIWEYIQENSRDIVKKHYRGKNPTASLKQALLKFEGDEMETIVLKNKWYVRISPDSTKYLNMGKD
ncbi:hypothetical protein [Sutterella wadsworthensis]|uniref:hypothetical protein n=1 Tax=Sutterella wadsworthensis TaxID=40545 RepID=UPI0032C10269